MKEIWTIGYSTHPIDEFIGILKQYDVQLVTDVRQYPGSRKYPQYNRETLYHTLGEAGIEYAHFPDLSGRRKPKPDSHNTAWRSPQFRGYADYMETEEFLQAIGKLMEIAQTKQTAIMCAEAVWWRCHRSLISDYLKASGWFVTHILSETNNEEHPFTSAARIVDGRPSYRTL